MGNSKLNRLAGKIKGGAGALLSVFPSYSGVSAYDARNVDIPSSGGGLIAPRFSSEFNQLKSLDGDATGESKNIPKMPTERLSKYPFFRTMASDPTIDSAIKMHLSHAFSSNEETGDIVRFESVADEHNEIVEDLRNTFKDMINENLHKWAYPAAIFGVNYARIYGENKIGITHIRNDYYTNPEFVKEFEQAGRLAGFTCGYNGGHDEVRLLEPWKMAAFKTPFYHNSSMIEPMRVSGAEVNLYDDDLSKESLSEAEDYGTSLIETAYEAWFDLNEAILSLNMSRKNAARLDRMVGVQMGRLNPAQAASYLNTISRQFKGSQRKLARNTLRRDSVSTINNILLPIQGEHGGIDINTVEGTPDIQGLEDVYFHVKRLGSAIGIDPALLGFGEFLSGGLGDGGFFRVSILAAQKSHMLRKAAKQLLERMCEIHVAYKYGKFFPAGTKPWRIVFESVSTAMEQEAQTNLETRVNLAVAMATLVQTLDPEMRGLDKHKLENYLFTNLTKMDEETFKEIFPEKLAKEAAKAAEEGENMDQDGFFESVQNEPQLRQFIYEVVADVMN
jgi:hypothetical protein